MTSEDFYKVSNMVGTMGTKEHSVRKRMLSNIYSRSHIFASPNVISSANLTVYDRCLPISLASSDNSQAIDVLSLSYAYSIDAFTDTSSGSRSVAASSRTQRRETSTYEIFSAADPTCSGLSSCLMLCPSYKRLASTSSLARSILASKRSKTGTEPFATKSRRCFLQALVTF